MDNGYKEKRSNVNSCNGDMCNIDKKTCVNYTKS